MQSNTIIRMTRELTLLLVYLLPQIICAPVSSTTAPISTTVFQQDESTQAILLDDFINLSHYIKNVHMYVTDSLNNHCVWLGDEYFPPEYKGRCLEYGEHMGTMYATCTATTSTVHIPIVHIYNGSIIPIKETILAAMESLGAHRSLLKGVLNLPGFKFLPEGNCLSAEQGTLHYCNCVLKSSIPELGDAISTAEYICTDVIPPTESFPEDINCEIDGKKEKTAPLGILWKIQSDLHAFLINVRQGCERVKLEQGNTSDSCP